jgi:hypothetical protein
MKYIFLSCGDKKNFLRILAGENRCIIMEGDTQYVFPVEKDQRAEQFSMIFY